ncbi:unnamed protein product [Caenorhabditis nigoni]|nr:hypothetical protein B9Z55_005945 [Caenorhabditis nigoni]
MPWVKLFILLLFTSIAFQESNEEQSENLKCIACATKNYKLINQILGFSFHQMEMNVGKEVWVPCDESHLNYLPCDGHCVFISVIDERKNKKRSVIGYITGCSTNLVHVDQPTKPRISPEYTLVPLYFQDENANMVYKFSLRTREKFEERSVHESQPIGIHDIFFIILFSFLLLILLFAIIVIFRQPHVI